MMHLLTCPNCQASIPVAKSQAGGQLTCPDCQNRLTIPKLGDLKQLPLADQPDESHDFQPRTEISVARRFGSGLFAFITVIALLTAIYCGIRWFLIENPITTEQHVAELRTEYRTLDPARLIREYEAMEKYGLELPEPFKYKKIANNKWAWGRNALTAGGTGLLSLTMAILLGMSGRKPNQD